MTSPDGTRADRYLVTGAMGCLGAWTVRLLLDDGAPVVALDLSSNPSRLRLLCSDDELAKVEFVAGDISEAGLVARVISEHRVTHVIHCAALQVPFVRADPPMGSKVNVLGTINVFEGVRAHQGQIEGFAYASSAAVFGPASAYADGAVVDDSPQYPTSSLYAVFKAANELTSQVYFVEHGVVGIGMRPFVVYGPGRDQGMTSGPTVAILAAVVGGEYRIGFKGPMYFNFARDTAVAFIAAARLNAPAPTVYNIPGITATVEDVIATIERILPAARGRIVTSDVELQSPSRVDASRPKRELGLGEPTPLAEGIEMTATVLRRGLERGLLHAPVVAA